MKTFTTLPAPPNWRCCRVSIGDDGKPEHELLPLVALRLPDHQPAAFDFIDVTGGEFRADSALVVDGVAYSVSGDTYRCIDDFVADFAAGAKPARPPQKGNS